MKERVARVADDDPPVNVEAHFEKYSLLLTSYGHFTNNFLKTQIVHFVDTICPRGPIRLPGIHARSIRGRD